MIISSGISECKTREGHPRSEDAIAAARARRRPAAPLRRSVSIAARVQPQPRRVRGVLNNIFDGIGHVI